MQPSKTKKKRKQLNFRNASGSCVIKIIVYFHGETIQNAQLCFHIEIFQNFQAFCRQLIRSRVMNI